MGSEWRRWKRGNEGATPPHGATRVSRLPLVSFLHFFRKRGTVSGTHFFDFHGKALMYPGYNQSTDHNSVTGLRSVV